MMGRLPKGVTARFHNYCDNCREVEIIWNKGTLYSHDAVTDFVCEISCEHFEKCNRLHKRLQERKESNETQHDRSDMHAHY